EPPRAEEWRRPPEAVDLEHLVRDRDLRVLADLLTDELHRKERREIVGPTGCPVPGCNTGCGAVRMSERRLYQCRGSCHSSSRNFVCASVAARACDTPGA